MATVNSKLRDEAIARKLFSGRYSNYVAKRIVKKLNEFDTELVTKLVMTLDDSNLSSESFTVKRLESLLGSVRKINKQSVTVAFTDLADELLTLAKYEAGYYPSLFESLLPDIVLRHYPLMRITQDMIYAATMGRPFQGKLLSEWASGLEQDRLVRISNTVKNGYLNGDSAYEIGKKIRGHAALNYSDGALQMSRANATSIAKTAVSHLQSIARNEFAYINSELIDCKQWLSTLDNKTSTMCIIRDHKKYTLDGKPIGHKIPYLQGPGRIHFCCRSTENLVTKSWKELGINANEMPVGTRASMDGQVPADISYLEWLKNQPLKRQIEILGETRARLMRDGGIDPSAFFTDKGEFINLDKLKELDEKAFEDAGYE
ncbi:hypothetical protein LGZ99_20485 [Photorhabdus temperata]|uniref:Phage Mu protein F like protein n=1 Tax=Photorhabdus temperata subsp. temperata Meg1 TaxID=1393735 RepID=A0A081RS72_PHOTE|nr:phage Mu F like family protein [Photorhabdus temperata]KER01525.1 hypothetical protein MEG1DRAFT_03890 [Photorhabdus temperata subsp. temperata Meg1]MCT8349507.1 hypothetical protein [Photorhabdus temperata]